MVLETSRMGSGCQLHSPPHARVRGAKHYNVEAALEQSVQACLKEGKVLAGIRKEHSRWGVRLPSPDFGEGLSADTAAGRMNC